MNVSEARVIVEKYKHLEPVICDPNLKTREDLISDKFLIARSYLSALEGEEVKTLIEALETSRIAINDWLYQYAPEFCAVKDVQEAIDRIGKQGTLSYIANVQKQNCEALAQYRESIKK